MERLFSNKKIGKSRQDISGYACSACDYTCMYGCADRCTAACGFSCSATCMYFCGGNCVSANY